MVKASQQNAKNSAFGYRCVAQRPKGEGQKMEPTTVMYNEKKIVDIVTLKMVVAEKSLPIEKVRSSFEVGNWLIEEIGDYAQEHLALLCLNTKNEITHFSIVHVGTLNQSVAHPRCIFQRAILANAARIMISHNHPSGNTTPSENDIQFTNRLIKAGEVMGIELLDHIIVGQKKYLSLREEGYWN